jgi:hypothetical protein
LKRFDLIKISYRYFKGLIDLSLDPKGRDMRVYADNGVGKTSLFDGLTYLLFDKDSENQSPARFGIKTTDKYGIAIPGVSHEVEGVFQYGPRQITLKKIYSEVWTKQRGSTTAQMTGHTTDYYIDGVPMQLKEYAAEIGKIVSEETFKLLTNPRYFSTESMFDWKSRRKLLLAVCGDVSDEDVIASNSKLSALPAILQGRDIESQYKVIHARRKEINDNLKELPARIDEANRSKPDTDGLDEAILQRQIEAKRGEIASKESEIASLRSGGEITVKQNRIREIDGELQVLKNTIEAESYRKVSEQRRVVNYARRDVDQLLNDLRREESTARTNEVAITTKNVELDDSRSRYGRINSEVFPQFHHSDNDTCPACSQSLPSDQVQAAHDKAQADYDRRLAEFNQSKSQRLTANIADGKAMKTEVEKLEAEITSAKASIKRLNEQLVTAKEILTGHETYLKDLEGSVQRADSDPSYFAKLAEKSTVQAEIEVLRTSTQEAERKVQQDILAIRDSIQALEQDKAKFEQISNLDKRIEQLKDQERTLTAEYEKLEHELWMLDEFTKQKVSMLESKINSKFKHTRFKLFEIQVNGGLKEMCEPTNLEGVPYSGGLNNAARINCGLDIINTLSEHFDLAAPIFIDNAEGVTRPIETHGQQIRLIVSEMDKKLRVEMVDRPERVAV